MFHSLDQKSHSAFLRNFEWGQIHFKHKHILTVPNWNYACVQFVLCMHAFTVHTVSVLSCTPQSLTYCGCACRSPQSRITSSSTPADLWGQRCSGWTCQVTWLALLPTITTPTPPLFVCEAPLLLPLSGWKWTDGWGMTACDPQLNSLMCSYSTRITPACSCDMATLRCSTNTASLNMESAPLYE